MALMAVACGSARKKKGKKKRAPTGGHLVADRERGKGKRQMLFRNVMSLIWYLQWIEAAITRPNVITH